MLYLWSHGTRSENDAAFFTGIVSMSILFLVLLVYWSQCTKLRGCNRRNCSIYKGNFGKIGLRRRAKCFQAREDANTLPYPSFLLALPEPCSFTWARDGSLSNNFKADDATRVLRLNDCASNDQARFQICNTGSSRATTSNK